MLPAGSTSKAATHSIFSIGTAILCFVMLPFYDSRHSNHKPVTACAPDKQKQIGLNVSVSTSTTVPNQRERIHTIDDLPDLKIGHGIKILAQDLVLDPVFPATGDRPPIKQGQGFPELSAPQRAAGI